MEKKSSKLILPIKRYTNIPKPNVPKTTCILDVYQKRLKIIING
jgi:hypothetical protein